MSSHSQLSTSADDNTCDSHNEHNDSAFSAHKAPPLVIIDPPIRFTTKRSVSDESRSYQYRRTKRARLSGSDRDEVVEASARAASHSPSNRLAGRSCSPVDISSLDAASTMLSRAEEAGGNRTVQLTRGVPNSPALARASSYQSSQAGPNTRSAAHQDADYRSAKGSLLFKSLTLAEYLQHDDRPIFVVDATHESLPSPGLTLIFANTALRARPHLCDCVEGRAEDAALLLDLGTPFAEFKSWVIGQLSAHDISVSFPFAGFLWRFTTVRRRLRVVTATAEHIPHEKARSSLSVYNGLGSPAVKPANLSHQSSDRQLGYFDIKSPRNNDVPTDVQRLLISSFPSESPTSQEDPILSTPSTGDAGIQELLSGSISPMDESRQRSYTIKRNDPERLENMSNEGFPDRGFFDWTRLPMSPSLPEHIQFARNVDWASTSLGPMEEWSADLRGMCNLIMASPHPSAMYWGPDHVAIYNEPYILLAGQKHPGLMGGRYRDVWAEIWDQLKEVFASAMASAQATMKDDDCLFIYRQGFLEETYFSWSIIPLIGDDGSVVGLYNPAFEKTRRKIAERRMLTLREIGEKTATARAVSQFWPLLVEGLQYNEYDAPMVIIYSLLVAEDSDAASATSSAVAASTKSCHLEGVLGVEPGHPAAPRVIDLKNDTMGFATTFKKAITADKPIVLSLEDGTLDPNLLAGVNWRGFGDPSRCVVVSPIRPTTGESTLGFLVMATNPRRPYDEDYDLFVQLLGRQLATSVASVVLFEEEIQKGERAAQMAAQDRIELSNQLAARTQEAMESENKFTRMAELAPVGMYMGDADGQIIFANETWYQFSGYPRTMAIGNNWLQQVYDDDRDRTGKVWESMLQNKSPISIEFRFKTPWRVQKEVDTPFWVIASASPELDEDGNIYRIFGSVTDISSQKYAEALQKRRMEEAVEMKRQQERYIDTTSHEMRNPLSAILQSADSIATSLSEIRDANSLTTTQLDVLDATIDSAQTITLCAQHQKRIVDDVLTLSKLDSAMLLVTPVDSQPVKVVQRALKMFEGELHTADIALDVRIDKSYSHLQVDWVRLDPTRLSQVLINLTTNAIKFTTTQEKRTIRMHVAASKEKPSQEDKWKLTYIPSQASKTHDVTAAAEWGMGEAIYIHFAVQDTGRGLTESERTQLFRRFSQANPRTHVTYGGSGLGLFISRELVELQGGEIGVASEAGKGSTFAFYVKARRSAAPAVGSEDDIETVQSRKGSKNAGSTKVGMSKLAQSLSATSSHDTGETTAASIAPAKRAPLHILVVEDNLINQKVLAAQLRKSGCTVYVANHGGEAIDQIKQSTFHRSPKPHPLSGKPIDISVVLMDLEMPVMDGQTCARELRKMQLSGELVRHVPVIAVTANAREEQIRTTLEAGIDDVVSKPFRIVELEPKMLDVISRFSKNKAAAISDGDTSVFSIKPGTAPVLADGAAAYSVKGAKNPERQSHYMSTDLSPMSREP